MTAAGWIFAGVLNFACSMAAFVVAVHFDLEGRWEQRRIAHGEKLDARRETAAHLPGPSSHVVKVRADCRTPETCARFGTRFGCDCR